MIDNAINRFAKDVEDTFKIHEDVINDLERESIERGYNPIDRESIERGYNPIDYAYAVRAHAHGHSMHKYCYDCYDGLTPIVSRETGGSMTTPETPDYLSVRADIDALKSRLATGADALNGDEDAARAWLNEHLDAANELVASLDAKVQALVGKL
jgi:hypothetical protein